MWPSVRVSTAKPAAVRVARNARGDAGRSGAAPRRAAVGKVVSMAGGEGQGPSKVALVTGGSRGIGAATSKLLAVEYGYAVAVNYLSNKDRCDALVAEIEAEGGRALAVYGDVSQEADVLAMFQTIDEELGPLDALVNNAMTGRTRRRDVAGILGDRNLLPDVSVEEVQRMLGSNVLGPILCSREAVKRMSTATGGKGGCIVNVSSGSAYIGSPRSILYSVSKGALNSLAMGLTASYTQEGIRINTVSPGMTKTDLVTDDMIERAMPSIPLGRAGEPVEIAETIAWLLSDKASYICGANIRAAGGRP